MRESAPVGSNGNFIGRTSELDQLDSLLDRVRSGTWVDRGLAVLLRGRRRVGKSRLANRFAEKTGLPYFYFQAARHVTPAEELEVFARTLADSTLPNARAAADVVPTSLTGALDLLARCLPETPSVVVIDEIPWFLEGFPGGAGELQRAWDRALVDKPVLLLLLGSDLGMMEALGQPGEPFYGRATPMVLRELTPRDVGNLTGLGGMDALDAYLITGGQPIVAREWATGETAESFVRRSFDAPISALVVAGARALDSEFGNETKAGAVLRAVGARGERTYSGVLTALRGAATAATLDRSLGLLREAGVLAADEPFSTKPAAKDRRWRVADPALQFWLAFVEPALDEIDRGRPDLAMRRFEEGFTSWRGRAIEPVVRSALGRLLPDDQFPDVGSVGGWWPRNNVPEIDLVGADRRPASVISFVGTIKWRAGSPLTYDDVTRLERDAISVPGVGPGTARVAVCPAGSEPGVDLDALWTADELLAAWR